MTNPVDDPVFALATASVLYVVACLIALAIRVGDTDPKLVRRADVGRAIIWPVDLTVTIARCLCAGIKSIWRGE